MSSGSGPGCAIVFGAGSGIGAATAMAFAGRRIPVVATSRHPDGLAGGAESEDVRSLIDTVAADATDPDDVDRVFTRAETDHGPVRTVIHSVGFAYDVGWFRETGAGHIADAIAALVTSPALVVSRALRCLRQTGGTIGIVSSGAAGKPTPGRALYSASKIAVNRLVESVAAECAADQPDTAVFTISPGRVDTPMQRRLMRTAEKADPAFRLERFTSGADVFPAGPVGDAIVDLALRPATELNGRLFRYRPDGWEASGP